MTILIESVIALVAVTVCGLLVLHASEIRRHARNHARDAAAFARRDAEAEAADPAPLEVDRGAITAVRPLRLVHLHEREELLIDAALRRHPAGSKRVNPEMSPRHEGMATPGAAVAVDAPGVVSKS